MEEAAEEAAEEDEDEAPQAVRTPAAAAAADAARKERREILRITNNSSFTMDSRGRAGQDSVRFTRVNRFTLVKYNTLCAGIQDAAFDLFPKSTALLLIIVNNEAFVLLYV